MIKGLKTSIRKIKPYFNDKHNKEIYNLLNKYLITGSFDKSENIWFYNNQRKLVINKYRTVEKIIDFIYENIDEISKNLKTDINKDYIVVKQVNTFKLPKNTTHINVWV